MKKLLISIVTLLCVTMTASANSYIDALNSVTDALNVIDRTESVINRVNNKANRVQNAIPQNNTKAKTKTTTTTTTRTTGTYSQQPANNTYSGSNNSNQYYNTDVDVPEYSQSQQNSIGDGGYNYIQNRTYTGNAKTLGELPAGVLLMDPTSVWNYRPRENYSGDIKISMPVIWRKLEDNHYAQGATLLLSEVDVVHYPFCHSQKGLRDWSESDVRRFLRTTFYTHLSQGFKNAIINVNIPFADLEGKPKTIVDNLFLLSIVEWGLSDRANNGTVIKYNDLPAIYRSSSVSLLSNGKIFYSSSNGRAEFTRTINRPAAKSAGYSNDVFSVANGSLTTDSYSWDIAPVRPAVNLKSSTPVKGPFEFKFAYDKNIIYYVLDFDSNGLNVELK